MSNEKIDRNHEVLGRQAAVRTTLALKLRTLGTPPQGVRMLGSGTHEDMGHPRIFLTLQRSGRERPARYSLFLADDHFDKAAGLDCLPLDKGGCPKYGHC